MLNRIICSFAVAAVSVGALGCQNKLARERNAMYEENRALRARLEERQAMQQPPMVTVQEPAPAPAAPETPAAPTPAGDRVAAQAPPPDIEGAETESDPVSGDVTVNISSDVLFDSGKATLRTAAKKTLDQVAEALNGQYAGKSLRVEGHTDSDPIRLSKWKSNEELSEARAKSVRDYLVSKGVAASRITTAGMGADKPRGDIKSRNRRVEIVVVTR